MSTKQIPTPTPTVVCDLCGKPVDTYAGIDRVALNWGTTPLASNASPRPRHFMFFRHPGDRTSGAPKGDYRSWTWDFHGECLVKTLEPLVIPGSVPEK